MIFKNKKRVRACYPGYLYSQLRGSPNGDGDGDAMLTCMYVYHRVQKFLTFGAKQGLFHTGAMFVVCRSSLPACLPLAYTRCTITGARRAQSTHSHLSSQLFIL